MKVIDLRRHLPEPGTLIKFEAGDIIRLPDGHNFKVSGFCRMKTITDEEAEEAQAASDKPRVDGRARIKASGKAMHPHDACNTDWITRGRETYNRLVQKYHDDLKLL